MKCLLLNKVSISVLIFWYEFVISDLKNLQNSKQCCLHRCKHARLKNYARSEQGIEMSNLSIKRAPN